MKRFSEQLNKQALQIKMTALERRELRERLVSYVEYHPLPESVRTAGNVQKSPLLSGETFELVSIFNIGKYVGAFATLILLVVPLVAERTVPGDVLYPVKVQFNEEIRGTLTLSPYEKVAWETTRLERRIAEARLLASEGRLTPEVEAEVVAAVRTHSDAAHKEIESIRETDGAEAAIAEIALASALDVQSEMLANITHDTTTTESPDGAVALLAGAVAEVRSAAGDVSTNEALSYEKLMARLEIETTTAQELFTSIAGAASDEERSDIDRRLGALGRVIAEARAHSEHDSPDVLAKLTDAFSDTRKLISFMADIDVRAHVAINDLVPVVQTAEERTVSLASRIALLEVASVRIESNIDRIPDELREKTQAGIGVVRSDIETASSSRASGDLDGAENALVSADAVITDIMILVGGFLPPIVEGEVVVDPVATTSVAATVIDEEPENPGADEDTPTEPISPDGI